MIREMEHMLAQVTHYDRISLQPSSGANGELAGLNAIQRYHVANNEAHRHICLIPTSAHGTNPASASMCGMTIVPVKCDDRGQTCMEDLKEKLEKYGNELSCIMITYPSTYGIFETTAIEICDLVH